ncbi:copper chaperone PCu(A)C [Phyllobacterium sp. 628]|uniref:copper chaperone PCu(A)C n=1 Tax=Phyllobacterium sp. 628 TaxID=2718938 RepID=UPI0016623739|nr:copper chaperone PCu(A)C [Phyllobacterium sp. 628]QND51594.1 copper chaperone PCu(A)C [Phyllobacterium sp. 628]
MNYVLKTAALALFAASFAFSAQAHDHSAMSKEDATAMEAREAKSQVKAGDLVLAGAYARATLPGAKVGGGYVSITNGAREADRLLGGSSPAAGRVEVHEMKMEGEVMKMRKLADGVEIPAGGIVRLAPGGLHLMLIDIKAPLKEGETIPVTLEFQKAGKVNINLAVEAANASMEHGK